MLKLRHLLEQLTVNEATFRTNPGGVVLNLSRIFFSFDTAKSAQVNSNKNNLVQPILADFPTTWASSTDPDNCYQPGPS